MEDCEMRKKVLTLLLGGMVAVGSLALQTPMTAQAANYLGTDEWKEWRDEHNCTGCSDAHITSSQTTAGSGQIKVTLGISYAAENPQELIEGSCGGAVYVCEQEWTPAAGVGSGKVYYNMEEWASTATAMKFFNEGVEVNGKTELTIDGLTGGKVYYIYCQVYDVHGVPEASYGEHYAVYLGSEKPGAAVTNTPSESRPSDSNSSDSSSSDSSTPGSNSSSSASSCGSKESAWASYEGKVSGQIKAAESGSTVVMEKGVSTLSNAIMKELAAKGDVSLKLEFTYEEEEYVIVIPAGKAVNDDIPWYGPLYLAAQYGNSAKAAAAPSTPAPAPVEANKTYEVQRGDNMNKIATANNMTLTELLSKNPQIKNPNKIAVGQKINL